DSFGSVNTDPEMFRQMRHAGVRIEQFHPIRPWENRFSYKPFSRDHRKLLVIDDSFAWLGGLNIGAEYAGSWVIPSETAKGEFWRDNGIALLGPSSRYFLHAFVRMWRYVNSGGRVNRAEYVHGIDLAGIDTRRRIGRARTLTRRRSQYDLPAEKVQPDLGILASTPTTRSVL